MKSIYVRLSRHFLILLVLFSFVLIPTFSSAIEVTITHESIDENGIRTLEVRGTDVHIGGVLPTVTLAGSPLTVLSTNANGDQIVVSLPSDQLGGTFKLSVTNTSGTSTFDTKIEDLSADGSTWELQNAAVPWGKRRYFGSVVYDNKMWLMGGDIPGSESNEVWNSSDGVNWTQVTPVGTIWSARERPQVVVFNGKMWLMGGKSASGDKNDVWSSTDGANWTEETSSAAWAARHSHDAVVFNNEMWVIGGNNAGYINDVWHSTDGINWTEATSDYGWGPKFEFRILVYDNKMWMIGGINGDNEVRYSTDGITWTQAIQTAPYSTRHIHGVTVYKNRMWVMGGLNSAANASLNDVWSSTDGVNWTLATDTADWESRYGHEVLTFSDKMWVLGGIDGTGSNWIENVWSTAYSINDLVQQTEIDILKEQVASLLGGSGDDSADDVYITFAQEDSSSNPNVLDINGVGLFVSLPPLVILGDEKDGSNTPLTVSSQSNISGTSLQQVIVELPTNVSEGTHRLTLVNAKGKSEFDVKLSKSGIGGNDEFTKLLLHFDTDNPSFVDSSDGSSTAHIMTTHGGASSVANPETNPNLPFSTTSNVGEFDGTDDYLTTPDNADWNFGTGDFTIDMWVRLDTVSGTHRLISQGVSSPFTYWSFHIESNGTKMGYEHYNNNVSNNGNLTISPALSANKWYHLAWVRQGTAMKMFVNGESIGTNNNIPASWVNPTGDLHIAKLSYHGTQLLNGQIEELRVSKGIARWTADFDGDLPDAPFN